MTKILEEMLAKLPRTRREKIERRVVELATLRDLRQAVKRTQVELASSLGIGQDTVSRLEQRGDMLISTLERYIEAMGGRLHLVAQFPDRPLVVIDRTAEKPPGRRTGLRKSRRATPGTADRRPK